MTFLNCSAEAQELPPNFTSFIKIPLILSGAEESGFPSPRNEKDYNTGTALLQEEPSRYVHFPLRKSASLLFLYDIGRQNPAQVGEGHRLDIGLPRADDDGVHKALSAKELVL